MDTNGVAQSIDQYVWGPGSAGICWSACTTATPMATDEQRLLYRLAPLLPDRRQRQRHDDDQVRRGSLRLGRNRVCDPGRLHGLRHGD